ncbi:MAG: NINE protein [Bacteroidota bacterium]
MKNKNVAGFLAFFVGMFGAHRFYLGQRFRGIVMMAGFFLAFIATIESDMPFIAILSIIALVDAILFLVMPKEEFDLRYNQVATRAYVKQYTPSRKRSNSYPNRATAREQRPWKESGLEKYTAFDFEGAIEDFQESLHLYPHDKQLHFYLACCYSNLEDTDEALYHLDRAVELGFTDYEKIHNHGGLAYLRTQPAFDAFVRNQYQSSPQEEILPVLSRQSEAQQPASESQLLKQIAQLGELRDKGILTDQEFQMQKRKILPG